MMVGVHFSFELVLAANTSLLGVDSGPSWRSNLQNSIVAISAIAGGDSQNIGFVYLSHMSDLACAILFTILNNAEIVNPQIPILQIPRNSDGILEQIW